MELPFFIIKVKASLQYFSIIIGLLLAIWSQSWLLTILLFVAAIILWQPACRKICRPFINRLSAFQIKLLEWLFAISVSAFCIWFINTYAVGFYTLQSSSMSPSHNINEPIVINKLAYGTAFHIDDSKRYRRLNGYSHMQHGDVIAFHFPEADTSFVNHSQENYHFIKRQYHATKHYNSLLDEAVQYNPVGQRKIFIKRLIALPGDTLKIVAGEYFINSKTLPCNALMVARYTLNSTSPEQIKESIRKNAITTFRENDTQIIEMQRRLVKANAWEPYLSLQEETMNMPNTYVYPFRASYFWNASYLGPIIIPTKDKTVRLTLTNLPLYKRIIEAYEGNTLSLKGNSIFINGKISTEYTFKMNYYWVAGDNLKHSFDSRYWGFVPENHIIGRVEKLSDRK